MSVETYPWAPGFVAGDRPKIVTSRFGQEDSHTLERYLATGGYEGLRAALAKSPSEVHEQVRGSTLLGRGGTPVAAEHETRSVLDIEVRQQHALDERRHFRRVFAELRASRIEL